MTKTSLLGIIFTGFLIISGCTLESPEGSQNNNPRAYIEGYVQDSEGDPLYDVAIEITTFKTTCEEGGVTHGTVNTNAEGRFLAGLARNKKETVNCITLRTSSKTRPDFKDSTISRSADLDFKTSEPFDTETFNINY